jgi:hypothetical protein
MLAVQLLLFRVDQAVALGRVKQQARLARLIRVMRVETAQVMLAEVEVALVRLEVMVWVKRPEVLAVLV